MSFFHRNCTAFKIFICGVDLAALSEHAFIISPFFVVLYCYCCTLLHNNPTKLYLLIHNIYCNQCGKRIAMHATVTWENIGQHCHTDQGRPWVVAAWSQWHIGGTGPTCGHLDTTGPQHIWSLRLGFSCGNQLAQNYDCWFYICPCIVARKNSCVLVWCKGRKLHGWCSGGTV